MRLKTFCTCLALVTYSGISMEFPFDREIRTDKERSNAEYASSFASSNGYYSEKEYNQQVGAVKNGESDVDSEYASSFASGDCFYDEYNQQVETAKNGKIEKLQSLVGQGVDVNIVLYNGGPTPLIEAIIAGRWDSVAFFLNNGADLKKSPKALEVAIGTGKIDIAKLLLERGADPNVLDDEGNSMLLLVLKKGYADADIVKLLLEKGADPNVRDRGSNSVLMLALKKGYADIAKLFLFSPSNDEILDLLYSGKYQNPINRDKLGSLKLMEKLMSFKHYDTPNECGRSPLMEAISSNEIDDSDRLLIVRFLLKKAGVIVNRIDSSGCSVLNFAKQFNRDKKIIELLENAGALDYCSPFHHMGRPIERFGEYCRDVGERVCLTLGKSNDDTFNCTIKIKDKILNKNLRCESERVAKDEIADYLYNVLIAERFRSKEETLKQSLSSGADRPSSSGLDEAAGSNETVRTGSMSDSDSESKTNKLSITTAGFLTFQTEEQGAFYVGSVCRENRA